MKKKGDLLQLAYKFIRDEIDEITYISRHDQDWYEVKELASTDPITFGILLRKLSLPNRRKALIEASGFTFSELRILLLGEFSKSSSTISDLTNPKKSRRFSNELLGRLGIICRVPFEWVYRDGDVRDRWDNKNFDFSGTVLSCMKDIVSLLSLSKNQGNVVNGYVLRSKTKQDLLIRLESRADMIIVDFYHSDIEGLDSLIDSLKSTSLKWSGFISQSVVTGYRYWTFIGSEHESAITQILDKEFKYVNVMCL